MRGVRWGRVALAVVSWASAAQVGPAARAVTAVVAGQVEDYDHSVTIQFDAPDASDVVWTTGDGSGSHPEGGTGVVVGDPVADQVLTGTGTFDFWGYRSINQSSPYDKAHFTWWRSRPTPDVVRTAVMYNYVNVGSYPVTWSVAGQTGILPVAVRGIWGGSSECQVNAVPGPAGGITYNPSILQPVLYQTPTYDLDISVDCGVYPGFGVFNLHIVGQVAENCLGGEEFGYGSVTGSRATGQQLVAGSWHHHRSGIHLFGYPDPAYPQQGGSLELEIAGGQTREYQLNMTLDLAYLTALVCPGGGGEVRGHATLTY